MLIARGVLLPNTAGSTRDIAWIWMLMSLLFATLAIRLLKKYPYVAPLLAVISFVVVLFFGRSI